MFFRWVRYIDFETLVGKVKVKVAQLITDNFQIVSLQSGTSGFYIIS